LRYLQDFYDKRYNCHTAVDIGIFHIKIYQFRLMTPMNFCRPSIHIMVFTKDITYWQTNWKPKYHSSHSIQTRKFSNLFFVNFCLNYITDRKVLLVLHRYDDNRRQLRYLQDFYDKRYNCHTAVDIGIFHIKIYQWIDSPEIARCLNG
jgi:hypothetical protein